MGPGDADHPRRRLRRSRCAATPPIGSPSSPALVGYIWAVAYDIDAIGPQLQTSPESNRAVDLDPTADVHTVTLAFLRWFDPGSHLRRIKAGRATVEYGAYLAYRWQTADIPTSYLSISEACGDHPPR